MTFGEKLIQLRKENHLSQEDLAELLDVSRQSISKWETGAGYPETKRIVFLCKHFNVSMDDLLLDREDTLTHEKQYQGSIKEGLVQFLNNLNEKQRSQLVVLASLTMALAIAALVYFFGYQFGKFLGRMLH